MPCSMAITCIVYIDIIIAQVNFFCCLVEPQVPSAFLFLLTILSSRLPYTKFFYKQQFVFIEKNWVTHQHTLIPEKKYTKCIANENENENERKSIMIRWCDSYQTIPKNKIPETRLLLKLMSLEFACKGSLICFIFVRTHKNFVFFNREKKQQQPLNRIALYVECTINSL